MMRPNHSPNGDHETRERLLEAAARLFAEHGFSKVTVRDISSEAGANLAAVNYHFRDKLGLYKEVVQRVAEAMDRSKAAALEAGEGCSPEEHLRQYICSFLHSLLDPEEESWMEKLISREMTDPTPALDLIIEKGIKPTSQRLGGMVSQLLGLPASDERVWQCALSVQAQCLFYKMSKPVSLRMSPPGFKFTPEVIDALAEHIFQFSLGGIRAVAAAQKETVPLGIG
jgi:TetR/AcrR family transcriptional regulator, regulator of cefoperazone and chloramphenicol sensitivity